MSASSWSRGVASLVVLLVVVTGCGGPEEGPATPPAPGSGAASSASTGRDGTDEDGSDDAGSRSREATFEHTISPPALGEPICTDAGPCLVPSSFSIRLAGALTGTAVAAGPGVLDPAADGGYASAATAVFTGTVDGCGEGTAVMRLLVIRAGSEVTGTWDLVGGFGTGDLAALTGRGTGSGTAAPDGSIVGTSAGAVECDGSGPAGVDPREDGSEVATTAGPPIVLGEQHCEGDRCVLTFTSTTQVSGDLDAAGVTAGSVVLGEEPTQFAGASVTLVTGTAVGCRAGTAVVRTLETADLATGEGAGSWEVVDGYATAGLVDLHGGGALVPTDGLAAGEIGVAWHGRVGCD